MTRPLDRIMTRSAVSAPTRTRTRMMTTMVMIRLLVQQVVEQVRSLYDLSALLRRPKIADKYIRSVNSKSKPATLSDQGTVPLSVGFSRSDENHVMEKVLQWRGLTKSRQCIEFEDEDVALVGLGLPTDGVEDILWFCQRLARANTRRREQLQYWINHPYDPREGPADVPDLPTSNLAQIHVKQAEDKPGSRSQAPTMKSPNPDASRQPKSVMSKQSLSTAAVSDVHDTKTNDRPRTVYAPTAIGQGRSNSVPDPPRTENGKLTFPCPYCGMMLDSSDMQNRQLWKRHVFRDLRPYVCTFEDCSNAGKLYVSRHDWMHHEFQIHRREYVCKVCQTKCPSRKEMSTHLREHYGESISSAHLGVILDLCDHQVDISDSEKDSCLVCGEELSLSALQGHLAAHMEDIALFVLPSTNEEEETGGSRASVQAAKRQSKGTDSGTESEVSSLGFSVAGDSGQPPSDFSKLLASEEEEEYASKFSSWRTTDEDRESESLDVGLKPWKDPDEEARHTLQDITWASLLPEETLKAVVAQMEDPDEDVRRDAVQTLGRISDLPEDIFKISLEHVNSLIELLGEKKDYKNLHWLFTGFWMRREHRINSPDINFQLARRYILARYMVGEGIKAVRLAEEILYNCRRVHGTFHSKTLEMSTFLSQLYTSIAQRYQKPTDSHHMAQKYFKRSANLNENILRIMIDPSLTEFEGGPDGDLSLGGSTYEFDLSDESKVNESEHVRQHLLLFKLALQRLGDWPKDYGEYQRLNNDLFRAFPNELEGFEDIGKWNLKDFGGGKASSNEDMLDLESMSWGLDFSKVSEEELQRVSIQS